MKNSEHPAPQQSAPAPTGKVQRQTIVVLDILNRLEPEYHGAFREAIAAHKTARGRLLEGVPWPRPTYAGLPATAVADHVLMCSADHLISLAKYAQCESRNERLRERSRSSLEKRLAQLRALLKDATLPRLLRADIQKALSEFRLAVPSAEPTAPSQLPGDSIGARGQQQG